MSTWLYQFWFFPFKTAKHWGRGPRGWTAETLNFGTYQETVQIPLPNTPSMIMNGNSEQWDHFELSPFNASASHISSRPSQMCQWGYSCNSECGKLCFFTSSGESNSGSSGRGYLDGWPNAWHQPQFQEKLRNGLENNDFSNIKTESLPVALPQVVKAAKKFPDEMLQEAFGLSIIGRTLT